MYHAILFDLDDTLYDFRSFWRGRLERGLIGVLEHHPELDQEALLQTAIAERIFTEQWSDFLRHHGVKDEALIAAAYQAYAEGWFDGMELPGEAALVLETLKGRFKLGLITNGPGHVQRPKIERFGLAERMDVLVVSGEVGVEKPDPAIFLIALERLGVTAAQALFVGDSLEYDLRGAAAAGLAFVWFNRFQQQLPDDVAAPVATINQLADLLPLLEDAP